MNKIIMIFAAVSLFWSCSDDAVDKDIDLASISLSESVINADPAGSTAEIKVTSSGEWRVSGSYDWVSPSVVSGVNGESVSFVVDANNTDEVREATFKIFTGAAVASVTINCGTGVFLDIVSPSSVGITKTGQTVDVEVVSSTSEFEFNFSNGGSEWITFEKHSDIFGSSVLRFIVAENTTYDDRVSIITIGGEGLSPGEVTITQYKVDEILIDPTYYEFDLAERTFSIDVNSNIEHTVSSNDSWITVAPASRGLTPTTYQLHLLESTNSRKGSITINGGGIVRVINVVQKGNEAIVSIPDVNFREWLESKNYILMIGDGGIVTEYGLKATRLEYYKSSNRPGSSSVEGINSFPALKHIDLEGQFLKTIDISKLTNVSTVIFNKMGLEQIHLGDNPIDEISMPTLFCEVSWNSEYIVTTSLVITGSKLKSLLIPYTRGAWWDPNDVLNMVDVSGCPALETLDCLRAYDVLKTVYMKEGQTIPDMVLTPGAAISYR